MQTIAQALTDIFGADVNDHIAECNSIDIVRDWRADDGYNAEQIAAAEAIAAQYGYRVEVTRANRWINVIGPTERTAPTQAARDAMNY